MPPPLASPRHGDCAANALVPRAAGSPTPGTRPAPSLTARRPRSRQRSFFGVPANASSPGPQELFFIPGSRLGHGEDGGQCRFRVAGTRRRWHGRTGEWPFSKSAWQDSTHPRQSGCHHEGRRSLRSGDEQGSGGQESRSHGSEIPCPALEAGNRLVCGSSTV